ncbi:hypothetical protein HanXRQr2_Chr17g0793761 [Helianthus annuus]|uniref:Uncharacterized protein n=1 Tax=Helianthus annuus TaxID=4232 RepID=A0A9K3GUB0_HELAN|nr:hypothetical protein HanXRQr2_Chr17g0793761 [Helianthus annuus]KAJ0812413.1 hypothetical protein HanPSC8_Chr17g0761741 [Helianthus annuus]
MSRRCKGLSENFPVQHPGISKPAKWRKHINGLIFKETQGYFKIFSMTLWCFRQIQIH